jgi:hypothetical protein
MCLGLLDKPPHPIQLPSLIQTLKKDAGTFPVWQQSPSPVRSRRSLRRWWGLAGLVATAEPLRHLSGSTVNSVAVLDVRVAAASTRAQACSESLLQHSEIEPREYKWHEVGSA